MRHALYTRYSLSSIFSSVLVSPTSSEAYKGTNMHKALKFLSAMFDFETLSQKMYLLEPSDIHLALLLLSDLL